MRRGLLLVDLDNWLDSPEQVLGEASQLTVPVARGPRLDALVVAIGLNTATAARRLDRAFFEALVSALAAPFRLAPEAVRLELALTLVMPEAVDRVLERLVREAPSGKSAGAYDALLVLSRDLGLREALGKAIGTRLDQGRAALRWVNRSFERKLSAAALPGAEGEATEPRGDITSPIDTPALCAWAAGAATEGPGTLELLSQELDASPWWLTQLGITRGSLRGVERLTEQVLGGAPSLSCAPGDGVEVMSGDALRWPWRLTGEVEISPSSLGPGAVRLSWQEDSERLSVLVRTRLPIETLRDAAASAGGLWLGVPCIIDDRKTLLSAQTLVAHELLGGGEAPSRLVEVTLRGGARGPQRRMVGEVRSAETWWWHKGERSHRASAKCSVEAKHFDPLPMGELSVMAVPRRARLSGALELIFVAPVQTGASVHVIRRISTNTIGEARGEDGHVVAVLAAREPLAEGAIGVIQIQDVPASLLREALGYPVEGMSDASLQALRRLPLLVPMHPIFSTSLTRAVRSTVPCDSMLREAHVDATEPPAPS